MRRIMLEPQKSILQADENVLLARNVFLIRGLLRLTLGVFYLTNKSLLFSRGSFVMHYDHHDPLNISIKGAGPMKRLLIEYEESPFYGYGLPRRFTSKFTVRNPQFWRECIERVRKRRTSEFSKDIMTGVALSTAVMYDDGKRIEKDNKVQEKLYQKIPEIARKLGGKGLIARDFVDYFVIRGSNCDNMLENVLERLENDNILKSTPAGDIGLENRVSKTYSLV
jgi:hypothetical protein